MRNISLSFLMFLLGFSLCFAQENDSTTTDDNDFDEDNIDFSQFAGDVEAPEGGKSFASSKIIGISPSKLISVGYDYQLPFDMTSNDGEPGEETRSINSLSGLRLRALFPVISRNNIIVSLGAQYMESHYSFESEDDASSPLKQSLQQSALRSAGVSLTIFKPLNDRHFLLYLSSHDLNGDYWLDELQPLRYMKHSIAGVFGWKTSPYTQIGVGASRTYRVGELNYIPVVLYNHTAQNEKWGIEAVLPARGHYRRSFSKRSLLKLGYELEGNSYRLQNRKGEFDTGDTNYEDIELRRSELRFQAIYERSLSGFIWVSVQAGYRYNYNFSVDNGEFFRGFFGEQEYLMENALTNPLYFQLSLNLVSP